MSSIVHRVGSDDVDRYREIRLRALADAPEAFATTYDDAAARSDEAWAELVGKLAGADAVGIWVVERDDRWVAMAGSYRPEHDPDAIEVMQVWTAPEARRTGAAGLVMAAVLDHGRTASPREFGLWVADGNDGAVRFYESLGFAVVEDRAAHPPTPFTCDTRMTLEG